MSSEHMKLKKHENDCLGNDTSEINLSEESEEILWILKFGV